jgi:hypothetical protein
MFFATLHEGEGVIGDGIDGKINSSNPRTGVKSKSKAVPLHAMEALGGRGV